MNLSGAMYRYSWARQSHDKPPGSLQELDLRKLATEKRLGLVDCMLPVTLLTQVFRFPELWFLNRDFLVVVEYFGKHQNPSMPFPMDPLRSTNVILREEKSDR